jgi:hypothetical protein
MSRPLAVLVALMLIVIGSSSFVAARWPGSGVPCPEGPSNHRGPVKADVATTASPVPTAVSLKGNSGSAA